MKTDRRNRKTQFKVCGTQWSLYADYSRIWYTNKNIPAVIFQHSSDKAFGCVVFKQLLEKLYVSFLFYFLKIEVYYLINIAFTVINIS